MYKIILTALLTYYVQRYLPAFQPGWQHFTTAQAACTYSNVALGEHKTLLALQYSHKVVLHSGHTLLPAQKTTTQIYTNTTVLRPSMV